MISLFFTQISLANAQTKKNKGGHDKAFIGEWILNDVRVKSDTDNSDETKQMLALMKKQMSAFIGKASMKFDKNGNFTSISPDSPQPEKGTWRYDKATKQIFTTIKGVEDGQSVNINKDRELEVFDEQMPSLKMILKKKK